MDKTAREKIKYNISSNYFVEAGAGSGKTSVLVERMASMVESGIDISKICAITFTKAAAGEFYARFQARLARSESENAKRALQNIDLCFMGTIDAFCHMILSEHPAKAGIPSDMEILTSDKVNALRLSEYARIQNGDYSEDLQRKALRFKHLFYDHEKMFLEGVKTISDNQKANFHYMSANGNPDDILGADRLRLLEVLRYLKEHPEIMPEKQDQKSAASWELLLTDSDALFESWNDNLGSLRSTLNRLKCIRISASFDLEKLGPGYEHFFIPHITRKKVTYYELNHADDPLLIDRIDNLKFSIAMDFIVPAAKAITEELKRQGKLTFADGLTYLRDMLKKDAAGDGVLIHHIYNRHSYFLIDEFQDTNPMQAEIFFYLTARETKADWRQCIPKPGSIFIVGDPKQSIYRFHDADVSSFLRVRQLFENPDVGEVLFLTRNFRSSDDMCGWFNTVFSRLLPKDTEVQSRFSPIPLGEKKPYAASFGGVYRYDAVMPKSFSASEDPGKVADIIRRIVDNPEITIQDRDENGIACLPRPVEYRDFMVITPGKPHLHYYMKALSDAAIPFRVEGKVLFSECPALASISDLMAAVADPTDKKAVFASMHLSGCAVTRERIFSYSRRARQMSPAAVFSMLLEEERVFTKAGMENAELVYYALELLRNEEQTAGIVSLQEGAAYLAALIQGNTELERSLQLRPDANRVHIANLHKVKGLEAPVVILAEPVKKIYPPNNRIDSRTFPPDGWIFQLGDCITSDFKKEKDLEEEVLRSEQIRLLYVAATRAGNALIISYGRTTKWEEAANNAWAPLLCGVDRDIFDVLPAVQKEHELPEAADADSLYTEAENSSVLNDRMPEAKSYEIIRPSKTAVKSKIAAEEEYDEEASDLLHDARRKKNPALTGTMVHKLMESLVSSKNITDLSGLIREICDDYQVTDPYYADVLKQVGETIRSGGYPQTGSLPQDILAELLSAEEVHCELPFCHAGEENRIIHGVIDAAYRKDGAWHIVDYKTNEDGDDLDSQYEAQLASYISAFKAITGEDADAAVYHIEIN